MLKSDHNSFHLSVFCSDGLGQVLKLEPIQEDSPVTRKAVTSDFGSACVSSPATTLANDLTASLTLKSPNDSSAKCKKAQKKRLQTSRHLHSTHFGLNSILDNTPSPVLIHGARTKKIKRQSLRSFYGNSINSPNLMQVPKEVITMRRSPRLQGTGLLLLLLLLLLLCFHNCCCAFIFVAGVIFVVLLHNSPI